jgi:1,4-alpha-glucan branching enzyme
MLLRDYSRPEDDWVPNEHGGRENLEAVSLLRELNHAVHDEHPGVRTIAEESTAWPMVSRPSLLGGLGFDMKWDMGWMHDTLGYLQKDPLFRKYEHEKLTFRMLYAWSENFVLALSHDEVVHGKGSLAGKMFGDHWQKLAQLRALYGLMWAQPGKKSLFMGGELAQWSEWDHESQLDWDLLNYPDHEGVQRLVGDLNRIYRDEPALHELDFDADGFEWVDCSDAEQSVIVFLRHAGKRRDSVLVACNFTPVPRQDYRVGVPRAGVWTELLNSDAETYGGSGQGNAGRVASVALPYHDHPYSLSLTLPPLATLYLKLTDPETPAPGAVPEGEG